MRHSNLETKIVIGLLALSAYETYRLVKTYQFAKKIRRIEGVTDTLVKIAELEFQREVDQKFEDIVDRFDD